LLAKELARVVTATVLGTVLLTGCSMPRLPKFKIPRLYRITVQQGNVITQEMVDQLKPGMTRSQVAFIMGEPILRNTFDANRWDYIYTVFLPGYFEQETRVSLFFQEDALAYFTGDYAPTGTLPGTEDASDDPSEDVMEDDTEEPQAEATTTS